MIVTRLYLRNSDNVSDFLKELICFLVVKFDMAWKNLITDNHKLIQEYLDFVSIQTLLNLERKCEIHVMC